MTKQAQQWIEELLRRQLLRLPPAPRVPNRWEQREQRGERHHHQKARSRRLRQLQMIEAKKNAARTLARRGRMWPSKNEVLREIRSAPHVYL